MSKATDNSQFTITQHGTIEWDYPDWWYSHYEHPFCYWDYTFTFRGTLVRALGNDMSGIINTSELGDQHMFESYTPLLHGPSPKPYHPNFLPVSYDW